MATKQLQVNIGANTTGFNAGIKKAGASLKSFSSSLRSITLPLAGVGTASTYLANTFDKNMTKIKTLVGDSAKNFELYQSRIKRVSLETGRSANDLSDALFAVTSAGVKGAPAMELLEMASKASAVGMGDVKDIARATTGVMNAFAKEGMTATHSMNVFKRIVETGNLEASELAPTLGRVVGMAQTMGISFEEVGASIATFTRLGVDSASAVTGLRSIMAGLASPTQEAKDTMAQFGLSAEGLRDKLATDGLAGTLELLMEKTDGNIDALSSLFPNIRALTAVLGTAGSQGDAYKEVLAQIQDSHGALDEAFETTSKSSSFKLDQAMNGMKQSMQDIGAVILPMVASALASISNVINKAVTAFTSLDGETQLLIGSLTGVAIALPTIISLGGTLLSVFGAILSPIGLIVAGLSAVAYVIYNEWEGIKGIIVDIANYFIDLYNESTAFAMIIHGIGAFFKTMYDIAVAVIEAIVSSFQRGFGLLGDLFGGLGNIIKGALTFDSDLIGEGLAKVSTAVVDNFTGMMDDVNGVFETAGTSAVDNFKEAMGSALEREPIELISEEDVDAFVGKGADMATGLLDQIKGVFSGKSIELPPITTKEPPSGDDGSEDDGSEDPTKKKLEEGEENASQFAHLLAGLDENLKENLSGQAQQFADSMANSENPMKAFLGTLMQTAMKNMAVNTALSTSNAVTSATETASKSPFGAFLLPALIAGAMAVVSGAMKKVPKFAQGGIVSSPTLGLMGEYAGARSNPEVIAPLSKLNSMMGSNQSATNVNVGGSFTLSGEDLVVALDRAQETRGRFTE
jgi:TP901 family phage tail tape measure protein